MTEVDKVFLASDEDLADALADAETAWHLIGKSALAAVDIADGRTMYLPFLVRYVDSNGRQFVSMKIAPVYEEPTWSDSPGYPDLPWVVVLEDAKGAAVRIRVQHKSQKIN